VTFAGDVISHGWDYNWGELWPEVFNVLVSGTGTGTLSGGIYVANGLVVYQYADFTLTGTPKVLPEPRPRY